MVSGRAPGALARRLARLLPAEQREAWFEPAFQDALAAHLAQRAARPAWPARLLAAAGFSLRAMGLVIECARIRFAPRVRHAAAALRGALWGSMAFVKGVWRVNDVARDFRFAWRGLRRRPGFTLLALLTLMLGLGASTAIFSVVNSVLLRSLPYADADRLVVVWGDNTMSGSPRDPHSPDTYADYVHDLTTMDAAGGVTPRWNLTIRGDQEPERVHGNYASAGFLPMLGAKPVIGRSFTAADDKPDAPPVVLISTALWQRRFGASPAVIGSTMQLDEEGAVTVIGVLPAGFRWEEDAEVWLPLARNSYYLTGHRQVRLFELVAHIAPGRTLTEARAQASAIAARLAQAYPDRMKGIGVRVVPLRDDRVGPVRPALSVLFGAVGLVLLIACANVANLLLLRGDARRGDMAVCAALGASRTRLARASLAESLLLALLGGALGALLAWWGVRALVALLPADLPRRNEIRVDTVVFGFALLLALLTGLFAGLAPLLQSLRTAPAAVLRAAGRTSAGRASLRNALVAFEVALAVMVAAGALLLAKSFANLQAVNPGFDTSQALAFDISGLPRDPAERIALMPQLHARLTALPGVIAAGEISRLPLGGASNITTKLEIEGQPHAPAELPEINLRRASAGYFAAMRIPLLSGRMFTPDDRAGADPVVLINGPLADRFFPGQNPVGQRIRLGGDTWITITGVVGGTRYASLKDAPDPEVYLHTLQSPLEVPQVVVRTQGNARAQVEAVRAAIHAFRPELVIGRVAIMDQLKAAALAPARVNTLLVGFFALLALVLSSAGAWGLMSWSVAQRTREIGVRVSLGASPLVVAREVVGGGMRVALAGLAAGLAGALLATRALRRLLFEVSPTNVPLLAAAVLLLALTVLFAAVLTARRATRVDPVRALRMEN